MAQIQSKTASGLDHVDPVWARIRYEADEIVRREPDLASFLDATILRHDTLEAAVIERVGERLHRPEMPAEVIRKAFAEALVGDPAIAIGKEQPSAWLQCSAVTGIPPSRTPSVPTS